MTESSLLIKYRPTCFEEVVGQEAVVASLFNALKKKSGHAFLFIGPSGVGKTTLALLAAKQLGCKAADLLEIDGATHTGVEEAREVAEHLRYRPLGEGAVKAVILDECHMLSKNAWNSLLKIVEHPPEWVYWFFCTTEAGKVPASIKTRSLSYELKPVSSRLLAELVDSVVVEEKLKVPPDVIDLCAKEAKGSPRQALANLAVCAAAKDLDEATELLASAEKSAVAFELAQALYRGAGWSELVKVIANLNTENPESVRHVIRAYGTSMLLKSAKGTNNTLAVLEAFATPFNSSDGVTPLLLACGRLTQS